MKIICVGDVHLRASNPRYRKDDVRAALFRKLEWIFFNALKVSPKEKPVIILAGDVFDSAKTPYSVYQEFAHLLWRYREDVTVFAIYGQHDLTYHSLDSTDRTPLRALQRSGLLYILTPDPVTVSDEEGQDDPLFSGCSWGETYSLEQKGVLVIHTMVTENGALWPGQTEFIEGAILLQKTRFGLIVSGDNHKAFHIRRGHRHLINCGSLLRSNTDQMEHRPIIGIYDTITHDMAIMHVPIDPPENVFDLDQMDRDKRHVGENEKVLALIEGMKEKTFGLSFQDNLEEYIRENRVADETASLIRRAMEGEI